MEQDQKWIRSILRRGSKTAADSLVRAYYDEIYVFICRQTDSREDALDLTQECFLSALRSLHSYDPKKAGFRTWLYHIAANKVIDLHRRSKPVFVPLEEQELSSEDDFTTRIQNKELLNSVESFISGMDPAIQEVFRLHVYAEYSFPEIAAASGQPESKIKSQYYRLIAQIKKNLSEQFED